MARALAWHARGYRFEPDILQTSIMATISERAKAMLESPIRKLAPIADELEANGVKVYRLNIGQPKAACPSEAINAMKSVDMKILEYSLSQGYLHHRQKLAEYFAKFNINVTPDDCVITVGGTEAVLYAFMSCLNPG